MTKDKLTFTFLSLTGNNIETIAEVRGIYMFANKSSSSLKSYILKMGCTNDLKELQKHFTNLLRQLK